MPTHTHLLGAQLAWHDGGGWIGLEVGGGEPREQSPVNVLQRSLAVQRAGAVVAAVASFEFNFSRDVGECQALASGQFRVA